MFASRPRASWLALLALCVTALGTPSSGQNLTRQEAIDLVTAQVILPSPYASTLVGYSYDAPGPLPAGTFVTEFDGPTTYVLGSDTWFFWLDYTPDRWFVHPCALVFVDDATETVQTFGASWFPLVASVPVYSSFLERVTSPDIFYGNPVPPPGPVASFPQPPSAGSGTSTAWAVLAAGPAAHPASDADLDCMEAALQAGGSAPSVPPDNIEKTRGSKAALCTILQNLGQQAPPCDKLYFHWTGHGNAQRVFFGDPPDRTMSMTYTELACKIKDTNALSFCVTIEACMSGGGAAILSNKLGGEGVTSTDAFQKAGFRNSGSIFTKAFVTCIQDAAADSDGGGSVSYLEAKAWVEEQNAEADGQNPQGWDASNVAPEIYCSSKLSSFGCSASIHPSSPSAPVSGASDYAVAAFQVQGFKNGLLFFGVNGPTEQPFLGGTLCVAPPLARTPLQNSGGSSPFTCDGAFSQIVNDGGQTHPLLDPGPGTTLWCQYWYRDPQNGPGTFGTALSNGLQITYQ